MSSEKFIILDRDGVINYDSSEYVKNPSEWKPIPNSIEAIRILTDNFFNIIVITNQSGINRGIISYEAFTEINIKMLDTINKAGGAIHSIFYCPHTPDEPSAIRKPLSGMFTEASSRFNFNLKKTYAIGDSPRDIEAANSANCIPLAVRTGNGEQIVKDNKHKVKIFDDLKCAVDFVISK